MRHSRLVWSPLPGNLADSGDQGGDSSRTGSRRPPSCSLQYLQPYATHQRHRRSGRGSTSSTLHCRLRDDSPVSPQDRGAGKVEWSWLVDCAPSALLLLAGLALAFSVVSGMVAVPVTIPAAAAAGGGDALRWRPCYQEEGPFECATQRVPLDHDRPRTQKISIALIRQPAAIAGPAAGFYRAQPWRARRLGRRFRTWRRSFLVHRGSAGQVRSCRFRPPRDHP